MIEYGFLSRNVMNPENFRKIRDMFKLKSESDIWKYAHNKIKLNIRELLIKF